VALKAASVNNVTERISIVDNLFVHNEI